MSFGHFPSTIGGSRAWWRLRRHPALFWVLAGGLSLFTGIFVLQLVGQAESQASRFGGMRQVLVATRRIERGSPLNSTNSEVRSVPKVFVPAGVLNSPSDGVIVTDDLEVGEFIVTTRLAQGDLSPTASLIPPGKRAIAIPTEGTALPLALSDRVDVLATMVPSDLAAHSSASSPSAPTFPIARDAVVIANDDDGATVAVSEDEAARIAYALTAGVVTLVLRGP